jgi:glutathione reductase (NADPH)
MTTSDAYDLVVIGAGSGGVRCARMAARLGARVACIESRFWGGTCVNVGCVPKKLYVMGSEFSALFARSEGFGWTPGAAVHQWSALQAAVFKEVSRLSGVYDRLLENAQVERYWGQASLLSANMVKVGDRLLHARHIVIATGGKPRLPEFPGAEHALNSDQFFAMTELPRRSLVLGGGYIAVELAGILAAAGSDTTLVYRGEQILRGFDTEVRAHVQQTLPLRGVKVRTALNIVRIDADAGRYQVSLSNGERVQVDAVIAATGRTPNIEGLGLMDVGVTLTESGGIEVNEHFETRVQGIYAVGDVLNRTQLTPVALAEGMYVANRLFGAAPQPIRYDTLATAVFCQPPVGCVGLTEEECRALGRPFKVYRSRFKPMTHTFVQSDEKVFLKILVDAESDKVLGMHMVGENAGEIIQGFAAAMTCGITKQQLDSTLGIHPTVAEELVTMRDVSALITPA